MDDLLAGSDEKEKFLEEAFCLLLVSGNDNKGILDLAGDLGENVGRRGALQAMDAEKGISFFDKSNNRMEGRVFIHLRNHGQAERNP